MVIEVLGSRVIGPYFGVSLFVWTSLISVAMLALAGGYASGGFLSDRYPNPIGMYLIILCAGLLVLLIPALKSPVIEFTTSMGLRAGTFTASVILFGPSLFLLGCVSPYLVRIAANEMTQLGTTVGGFYAVSTLGSVVGTVITGFVLVAWMGVSAIFNLAGGILITLSVVYMLAARRFRWSSCSANRPTG